MGASSGFGIDKTRRWLQTLATFRGDHAFAVKEYD